MGEIFIQSPEGEKIELVSSANDKLLEGAYLGAQALLNLLSDEMDLEDGYEIIKSNDEEN